MPYLNTEFFDNPVRSWPIAAAVATIVFAALRIVRSVLVRQLRSLAARTSTDLDSIAVDFIIVGEQLGTVEHVGLKTSRLRSLSGEQLIFSNSDLLNSRIRNFERMFHRRVVFGFGVTYQTPYDKVAGIGGMVRSIIEGLERTRFDRAHFKEYGESARGHGRVSRTLAAGRRRAPVRGRAGAGTRGAPASYCLP